MCILFRLWMFVAFLTEGGGRRFEGFFLEITTNFNYGSRGQLEPWKYWTAKYIQQATFYHPFKLSYVKNEVQGRPIRNSCLTKFSPICMNQVQCSQDGCELSCFT